MGWPLGVERRRRVVHLPPREQPGLRRLRRAPELREPVSLPLHGVPALQAPPDGGRAAEGRQARGLWRARDHRGRLAVDAEGGLPGRRAAGLFGRPRERAAHQGQPQRDAVGHRGGRGGRSRASLRAASGDELDGLRRRTARRARSAATSSAVRNVKPLWSQTGCSPRSALAGSTCGSTTCSGCHRLRHAEARQVRRRGHRARRASSRRSTIPSPTASCPSTG